MNQTTASPSVLAIPVMAEAVQTAEDPGQAARVEAAVDRIITALAEAVPTAMKASIPEWYSAGTATAIVEDLIPRIRALRPAPVEQA